MKLTLDRNDLLPQHAEIACSLTRFEHFTHQVQAAIKAVGRAQFREYDGRNYNAIYAPKEESATNPETPCACGSTTFVYFRSGKRQCVVCQK